MSIFVRFTETLTRLRRAPVQLASTLLWNSYFLAPWLKNVPCPGFNCYSCPLAITACPIGTLQHFIIIRRVPLYLLGVLGIIGTLFGRTVCGWACPFGFLQDLLYKVPLPKWHLSNRWASGRYVIFALLVVLIPFIALEPWFCKLCPAGALEAGLPMIFLQSDLRELTGLLFAVKMVILALFLGWMMVTTRPFCRFVCPLGTIYGPFNRVSGMRLHFEESRCQHCDLCRQACPTGLYPPTEIDTAGCIRCMECLKACPHGALQSCPSKMTLVKKVRA
ncbi:MAG: 4Fe-4S binding protein [Anaerolineae bacterium]